MVVVVVVNVVVEVVVMVVVVGYGGLEQQVALHLPHSSMVMTQRT